MLTVAEYASVAEPVGCRYELCRGEVVRSPSPLPRHQLARAALCAQLLAGTPPDLLAIVGLDVDLGLGEPGTVRRPDIVVIGDDANQRVDDEQTCLRADEVRLVAEISVPDTAHTDRVVKRAEYADAGIPYYWLVDLDQPISLLPMHLAGEFGYADDREVTGECEVGGPFQASLRLDELAR